jgi:UDP-N-acetylglucosamine diphosphorylase/glucosamine-1-phosphate N-acetyltransferase
MKVIIYEDQVENLFPLVMLRPQYGLLLADRTIEDHLRKFFPGYGFGHVHRPIFGKTKIEGSSALYISSRLLPNKKIKIPKENSSLAAAGELVGFFRTAKPLPKKLAEIEEEIHTNKRVIEIDGTLLSCPWDLIKINQALLARQSIKRGGKQRLSGIEIVGNRKLVDIDRTARLSKMVSIDVTDGPVKIAANAEIRAFTCIAGPAYIGPGTILDRAKIIKSSIGRACRIGGEVEASIFQGYSNKYHEGFIGHSIIGEWVNLGALTTNSDLKNNYQPVKVMLGRKECNTGMVKIGCFIGDHTKTGIGTLIPTGAMIGCFVNFFGGGMMPRYVSDFKWVSGTRQTSYELDRAIATARTVMKRRDVEMTAEYEKIIRQVY